MDAHPDQLDIAIATTDHVISGITDAQLSLPTPCAEWDVRDLIGHIVGGNQRFASALGTDVETGPPVVTGSASDALDAYRRSAQLVTEQFHVPDALNQLVTVPFGAVPGDVALHLRIIDLLVHGWDLARATGQVVTCPDDLAEQEFQFTTAMLAGMPPERRPFGPAQDVAEHPRPSTASPPVSDDPSSKPARDNRQPVGSSFRPSLDAYARGMTATASTPRPGGAPDVTIGRTVTAGLLDVVVIVIFAAIGRASHAEAHPVLESLSVAWPFITGAAIGWALALGPLRRAAASLIAGVPIWLATVVIGMALRAATGRGIAISFIGVATFFLGAFLLGWRVILLGWQRRTRT